MATTSIQEIEMKNIKVQCRKCSRDPHGCAFPTFIGQEMSKQDVQYLKVSELEL